MIRWVFFLVIFVMALWQVRSAGFWKCNTSASRYFDLHFPTIGTIRYLDLPKGAKWLRFRVSIYYPLGLNWHPLEVDFIIFNFHYYRIQIYSPTLLIAISGLISKYSIPNPWPLWHWGGGFRLWKDASNEKRRGDSFAQQFQSRQFFLGGIWFDKQIYNDNDLKSKVLFDVVF